MKSRILNRVVFKKYLFFAHFLELFKNNVCIVIRIFMNSNIYICFFFVTITVHADFFMP